MKTTTDSSRIPFVKSLLQDMHSLEYMLTNGWFEDDITRIGAEQEMVIIDKDNYQPQMIGPQVLSEMSEHDWVVGELAQFNLEVNMTPQVFSGNCLSAMHNELEDFLGKISAQLADCNADYLLTGILPTLHKHHLDLKYLTPFPRYKELMSALDEELRGNTFELRLVGIDELLVKHDSPLLEACNTSFQVHLQVSPHEFVDYYNCALALTAPCISIASNSPMVFGKRLWHETRIALFQQAIDTRKILHHMREMSPRVTLGDKWLDKSVLEIFKDDIARFRSLMCDQPQEDSINMIKEGKVPKLKSLQLHNSTIYRWNRPCYGISDTGKPHLRIENRVFPAGPTTLDEMANMTFWIGAMIGMKHEYGDPRQHMSFEDVRDNFGKAARFGIDTKFTWFNDKKISAKDLMIEELIPLARRGLEIRGVDKDEVDKYLDVIQERAENHMTGARWILRSYTKLAKALPNKDEALTLLTSAMYDRQKENEPVHKWSEPTISDDFKYNPEKLNVSEFMETNLFTAQESDLAELVAQMMSWKDFSYMPVEDNDGTLIGIVSSKRIVDRLLKEKQKSNPIDLLVSDVMEENLVTIGPFDSIKKAVRIMDEHKAFCLPVVQDGELVGMLTESNFMSITSAILGREKDA